MVGVHGGMRGRGAQRGAQSGARRGVRRGVRRGCMEGCTEGCAEGCTEGCMEGVHRGVRGGASSLFVLGYHWLPLATTDLVGDNRHFEAFRHILSCYTHYSWLIVLDLQSFITICPWLPLVAPSNH